MWSSNDSVSPKSPFYFQFLGCAHIHKSQKAFYIHHQVFWFEITIDDPVGVEMLHHEEDLPDELASVFWTKGNDLCDNIE